MPLPKFNAFLLSKLHLPYGDLALLKLLLMGLLSLLLGLAFIHIGSEVLEGDTLSVDHNVLKAAQRLRLAYPWMVSVMRDLSGLGSTMVLASFTVATVGYLLLVSQRITAILVAATVLTGTALNSAFKLIYGRLRPDPAFSDFAVSGLSFPSGHASMSAIVFLTLGVLVASRLSRLTERVYILTVSVVLTLLVGVSRIVLGVHWTSDVLGGWAFGTAWAMAWLVLARQATARELHQT